MEYPGQVRIVEVGPRDGLQNESISLGVETKTELVNRLTASGLRYIEVGSFVSPKWVPQMAGSEEIFTRLPKGDNNTYAALTPNMRGLDRAIECGVKEVAVFAAASEEFSQRNINCSIAESLERFIPVLEKSLDLGISVRGYVSCVMGCPYEGPTDPQKVLNAAKALLKMGCYEISLGDTIGVGTPADIERLLAVILSQIPATKLAVHMHDTYGQALANVLVALQKGITVVDSAVAGLGGCPYAKGASGNLATEDLVYMLNGLGIDHGVNLPKLISAGDYICEKLNRANTSKVRHALI